MTNHVACRQKYTINLTFSQLNLMKNISTLAVTIILFFLSGNGFAQTYVPAERSINFGKTEANAWVISVDEEPLDALKKSWSTYAKRELGLKSKKDGRDALIAKEVEVPSISQKTGDLRMKVFTEDGLSHIAVAFTTGYSTSINTQNNPRDADNLRQLTRNFVKQYKLNSLNEQLAIHEKRRKSVESAYEKNEREQKKLLKQMTKNEKRMNSEQSEKNDKSDLKNTKIANQSRVNALEAIMINQKNELAETTEVIEKLKLEIAYLESIFTESITKMKSQAAPAY